MFKDQLLQQKNNLPAPLKAAAETFFREDMPTRKTEDWKYTDLSFLNQNTYDVDLTRAHAQWELDAKGNRLCISGSAKPATEKPASMKGLRVYPTAAAFSAAEPKLFAQVNNTQWEHTTYFPPAESTSRSYFPGVFERMEFRRGVFFGSFGVSIGKERI